jgi:DNA-binding response OmpR family regulator
VVDHEPLVRTMVGRALREHGLTVWTAVDAQHALELCRNHAEEIDMVLLDMRLPGLNGGQAVAALHALAPEAGVCFLGWRVDPCVKDHLLEVGATHVFDKPIRPAELVAVIERLLAQRRQKSPQDSGGYGASPAEETAAAPGRTWCGEVTWQYQHHEEWARR